MDPETRQAEWAAGMHTSSSGKQQSLKDLPTPYLKNIINKYGSECDTSAIQSELDSRPQEEEEQQ